MAGIRVGKLLDSVTTAGAGAAAGPATANSKTFHGVCVANSGAMNCVLDVQVSNDLAHSSFITAGTITLTGTGTQSDGFAIAEPWAFYRGNVTTLSGSSVYTVNLFVAES